LSYKYRRGVRLYAALLGICTYEDLCGNVKRIMGKSAGRWWHEFSQSIMATLPEMRSMSIDEARGWSWADGPKVGQCRRFEDGWQRLVAIRDVDTVPCYVYEPVG